ncbi:chromosome partitioning protein ParB [filamentous cyanobacterium LEGE 11480]|uniref:Chromosome partitioning protein ParB n=1 Tax=Romeriopsis navalis LEGE 11480 TaxID=2777977 RepID=A0A928VP01_9CYAN|nr:ParB/RepB/Spo0J family partition protein [Romeriopsis navalis]MBE9031815.1 chromosome partitioning protein ParB [Romeriopsis navalis LEGE 11480]
MVDENMKAFLSRTRTKAKKAAPPTESTLPIEEILPRPNGDTREINPVHVAAMVDTIATLGLISAITVDINGALIAGGHRKAAIEHLHQNDAATYRKWFSGGVPIRRYDFDAAENPELALAIEAAENEKRVDYTPGEVRELADRLRDAGYSDLKGRPKKGQKSVVLGLSAIIGKSHNTVRRYLSDETPKKATQVSSFSDAAKPTARSLTKLIERDDCPEDVRKSAERLLKKLEAE